MKIVLSKPGKDGKAIMVQMALLKAGDGTNAVAIDGKNGSVNSR